MAVPTQGLDKEATMSIAKQSMKRLLLTLLLLILCSAAASAVSGRSGDDIMRDAGVGAAGGAAAGFVYSLF